jgi:hypothetical protein
MSLLNSSTVHDGEALVALSPNPPKHAEVNPSVSEVCF